MLIEGTEVAVLVNEQLSFKNLKDITNDDKIVIYGSLESFNNINNNFTYVNLNNDLNLVTEEVDTKIYKLSNGLHALDGYKILLSDIFRKELLCVSIDKLGNINNIEDNWRLLGYTDRISLIPPKVDKIYPYQGNVYIFKNNGIKFYILCKHNDDKFIVKI